MAAPVESVPPSVVRYAPRPPSAWRAWLALVGLSLNRPGRLRQMVWISLSLLGLTAASVWGDRAFNGLGPANRRFVLDFDRQPFAPPHGPVVTHRRLSRMMMGAEGVPPLSPATAAVEMAVGGVYEAALRQPPVRSFTNTVVLGVLLGFLLPLWTLSFSADALGGERESRAMVWLLSRPLPRWAVYLAKYVALVPWVLAFNLGGFAVICLAAGEVGPVVFALDWPSVVLGSLCYAALFHLFGACVPRPTVVALVYAFFLETLLGGMPGQMKRISVAFYIRCMMYAAAEPYGLDPERPWVFQPLSGPVAAMVLASATVGLLGLGMVLFARAEYREET